jgi:hypothetical protein
MPVSIKKEHSIQSSFISGPVSEYRVSESRLIQTHEPSTAVMKPRRRSMSAHDV